MRSDATTNQPSDALDNLVALEIARDPSFAEEWATFNAALELRLKRKATGLSQEEIGRRIGVDQSGVARLEQDPSRVSMRRFSAYLAALGYRLAIVEADDPA